MVHGTFVNPLSLVRWNRFDLEREPLMGSRVNRPMFYLRASRIVPQEVVTLPIRRRPNRSRDKSAAAVRTDISQNMFDAAHAERALIRADPRLKRLRRQRLVAMLAGRSEFKQGVLDVKLPTIGNQWFLEPLCALRSPASSPQTALQKENGGRYCT